MPFGAGHGRRLYLPPQGTFQLSMPSSRADESGPASPCGVDRFGMVQSVPECLRSPCLPCPTHTRPCLRPLACACYAWDILASTRHASDEVLWSKIKKKRDLIKLASSGDMERLSGRIIKLKALIADSPASSPPAAVIKAASPSGNRVRTAKRKDGPYVRFGKCPAKLGIDISAVAAKVAERAGSREAKDFARADEIRRELVAMGGDSWGIKASHVLHALLSASKCDPSAST